MKHKNDLFFITKLNGKEKFSFRKISVGLVTVALGTTFFLASSNTVQAADQNNTASNQNISKELTSNNSVETTQKQELVLKTIHIVAIQVQKIIILQHNHLSLLKMK